MVNADISSDLVTCQPQIVDIDSAITKITVDLQK
jgi:hypothetical protein